MNDGGPAWPVVTATETLPGGMKFEGKPGMSLRDYFAAEVAVEYLTRATSTVEKWEGDHVTRTHTANIQSAARWCYEFADAMLAERAKQS